MFFLHLGFPMRASVDFAVSDAPLGLLFDAICGCFRKASKKLLLFIALGKATCQKVLFLPTTFKARARNYWFLQ
jgi:hypothetical protein